MSGKTALFEQHRSEFLNLAYGMLGDKHEARDVVQDAYLRWDNISTDEIKQPVSYLKTTVYNLCIDRCRSARSRRLEYYGPWLPEPLTASDDSMPSVELHEQLSIALLHLLEQLSPDQRAIYLLHDIFDYTFSEISDFVGKKAATCRKAAQRARKHIRSNKPPQQLPDKESRKLIERFISAIEKRDIDQLKQLLTKDAVLYSDGGGKANAVPKPIVSSEKIAKFLINIAHRDEATIAIDEMRINHRWGFRAYKNNALHSMWAFSIHDGRIQRIFSILNPDKLTS